MGTAKCKANLERKSTTTKPLKETKISGWLLPKPAARIAPTVTAPPPLQIQASFPFAQRPISQPASANSRSVAPASLLTQLEDAIDALPSSVHHTTESDVLAAFGQEPSQYVDADLAAVDVYEQLNPLFHSVLSWNMSVEETAAILRRGRLGLDGLLKFLKYFVHERGVREQDFAGKIQQILNAIHFL
jgi:hypothetical protein